MTWHLGGMTLAWADARALLVDYHCLWQDLDGLHVGEQVPVAAPFTSILHGWRTDADDLIRLRLATDRAHIGHLSKDNPLIGERRRKPVVTAAYEPQPFNADQMAFTVIEVLDTGSGAISFVSPAG